MKHLILLKTLLISASILDVSLMAMDDDNLQGTGEHRTDVLSSASSSNEGELDALIKKIEAAIISGGDVATYELFYVDYQPVIPQELIRSALIKTASQGNKEVSLVLMCEIHREDGSDLHKVLDDALKSLALNDHQLVDYLRNEIDISRKKSELILELDAQNGNVDVGLLGDDDWIPGWVLSHEARKRRCGSTFQLLLKSRRVDWHDIDFALKCVYAKDQPKCVTSWLQTRQSGWLDQYRVAELLLERASPHAIRDCLSSIDNPNLIKQLLARDPFLSDKCSQGGVQREQREFTLLLASASQSKSELLLSSVDQG